MEQYRNLNNVEGCGNLTCKICFCLIIFLCSTFFCNAQGNKKTDWENDGLKGKVKSVKYNIYEAIDKFGLITEGEPLLIYDSLHICKDPSDRLNKWQDIWFKSSKIYAQYDKNGYLAQYGDIDWCWEWQEGIYIYNVQHEDNYNTKKYTQKKHICLDTLIWVDDSYLRIVKYDDNGNIIEDCLYDNDILYRKTIYKYDVKKNIIEESNYITERYDSSSSSIVSKYGSRGYFKDRHFIVEGILNYKTIYEYDNNNNLIEKNTYNKEGVIEWKTVYNDTISVTYDGRPFGKLEKSSQAKYENANSKDKTFEVTTYNTSYYRKNEVLYDTIFIDSKETFKYNTQGKEIERTSAWFSFDKENCKVILRDGYPVKYTYEYDTQENVTIQTYETASGSLYVDTWKYKYDSQENWIEIISFEGKAKIPQIIVKRTIEYYE